MNLPLGMSERGPIVLLCDVQRGGGHAAASLLARLHARGLPVEVWRFSREPYAGVGTAQSLDARDHRPPLERLVRNFSRAVADRWHHRRHTAALLECAAARRPRPEVPTQRHR